MLLPADKSIRLLLQLGLAVAVFITIGYLLVKPAARDYPPYLSDSPDLDGTKAMTELLAETYGNVETWDSAFDELPQGSGVLLVMVQPDLITEDEGDSLLDWVEQGNSLLLFDSHPGDWIGYPIAEVPRREANTVSLRRSGSDEELRGWASSGYRFSPRVEGEAGELPIKDDYGGFMMVKRIGSGNLTAYITPDWVLNGAVLELDHFELVWPSFAGDWNRILWDESRHASYGETTVEEPSPFPLWMRLAALQLAIMALLYLWAHGKRFGPVYVPRNYQIRSGDETIIALSGWYARSRSYRAALKKQHEYMRVCMQRRWGLSVRSEDEDALREAGIRWDAPDVRILRELLEAGSEAGSRRLDHKRFLLLSSKYDQVIGKLRNE